MSTARVAILGASGYVGRELAALVAQHPELHLAACMGARAGITLNKNTVPDDPRSPFVTSGVRIGTPSVTTQGMGTPEMATIASLIARALRHRANDAELGAVRDEVATLCSKFPPY